MKQLKNDGINKSDCSGRWWTHITASFVKLHVTLLKADVWLNAVKQWVRKKKKKNSSRWLYQGSCPFALSWPPNLDISTETWRPRFSTINSLQSPNYYMREYLDSFQQSRPLHIKVSKINTHSLTMLWYSISSKKKKKIRGTKIFDTNLTILKLSAFQL